MSRHATRVFSESGDEVTPSDLAEALCSLRYDGLVDYLDALAKALQSDSEDDRGRGRERLAERLELAAEFVQQASEAIDDAWDICRGRPEDAGGEEEE